MAGVAVDTNVLLRLFLRDDARQHATALSLLERADASGEPVLVLLCTLLECEWVMRSRYGLDRESVAATFSALLESGNVQIEEATTLVEALHRWAREPTVDFADCLMCAGAAQRGLRFLTFDARAARLPGAELLK